MRKIENIKEGESHVKKGKTKHIRLLQRKLKYSSDIPDRAYKLCLLGLTDDDLAVAFGVAPSGFSKWKKIHKDLVEALKRGKAEADSKVAESLYKRALGYSHPDTHFTNYLGEVIATETIKHYPPDTTACIFWLKNRQKENWRDVQRVETEHTEKVVLEVVHVDITERLNIITNDLQQIELKTIAEAVPGRPQG